MKNKIIVIAATLLIITGIVLIKIFLLKEPGVAAKGPAIEASIPADVFITRDTTADYQITTLGTIRANESVDIVSEINKKIVGIYLQEGRFVKKGRLLFKLDDEEITAKLEELAVREDLAATTEEREKIRLAKGGISRQRYDAAANDLELIRAEIKALQVDLSKTEIIAPFSGKTGIRNVSIGAYVSPNTVLTSLQDISRVKIDFGVPEKYAKDIKPGHLISFSTDYSVKKFQAVVEACEPQIELQTRNLPVRAITENKEGLLIPGSSALVYLTLNKLQRSLFVPTETLIPTIKGYQVYLYRNGKAVLTQVKAGLRTKNSVQVVEGLSAGDTLITTNILRIKPGSLIKIINVN